MPGKPVLAEQASDLAVSGSVSGGHLGAALDVGDGEQAAPKAFRAADYFVDEPQRVWSCSMHFKRSGDQSY